MISGTRFTTVRIALLAQAPEQRGFWAAFRSVRDPQRNLFGLNTQGMLVVAGSLLGIGIMYADMLRDPNPLPELFALATARQFSGLGATYVSCTFAINRSDEVKARCEQQAAENESGMETGSVLAHRLRDWMQA